MKYYILRRKNSDSEGDKYSYHINTTKGVELTTPFKDKATIYSDHMQVNVLTASEWEFIQIKKLI